VLSGADNPLRTVFRVKPLPFRDALEDYLETESDDTDRVEGYSEGGA
jgi:hypothetical protein